MSEYTWIGLTALLGGLILGGSSFYNTSRRFVRSRDPEIIKSLRKQHLDHQGNNIGYSWYADAGLSMLGMLVSLGGAYLMGADQMAAYI